MKLEDIRKAITEKGKGLNIPFYYENINKIKRPCYFIELVDYSKEFYGEHKELKSITFDVLYFPADKTNYKRMEIINAMEKLDDNFEITDELIYHRGQKIIRVPEDENRFNDRYLTVKNSKIKEVDGIGHYIFDIDFFDLYGIPYLYELMEELKLEFKGDDN